MAHQKTEHEIDRDNRYGKPIEWLTAGVVGLASGAVTLTQLVRSKLQSDAIFRQGMDSISSAKDQLLMTKADDRIKGAVAVYDRHLSGEQAYVDFTKARTALNKAVRGHVSKSEPAVLKASAEYAEAHAALVKACGSKMKAVHSDPQFIADTRTYIKEVRLIKRNYSKQIARYAHDFFGLKDGGVFGFVQGIVQRLESSSPGTLFNVC